ncbi:prepilin peptidase [Parapusillimonas granuli]|uniref:Prepilin peptidase n=1 Tax=Parapusillimonas granuli TaxID=380911 RepID=A0A853FSP2_9BURK|nr:A24 family peptidase [Parapusillimonas granuli]MBB5214678.1 leader peptidase (prepilin peptidase)/N-methyltransferase [Parapusillimonas granuli]NYT48914.1 prepilin peptidase [Parapusillimonas granuli]
MITAPCALPAIAAGSAGFVLGAACARAVAAYARLVDGGHDIDGPTLLRALRAGFGVAGQAGRHGGPAMLCCGLVMAAAWAGLYCHAGFSPAFWALAPAAAMLLLLAGIDMRTSLLPDALTLPLMWLGLLASWAGLGLPLHDALAGAACGFLFLSVLAHGFHRLRGRPAMGGGDVKLLAALGAWTGWQDLAWVLLIASCLGIAYAMLRQRRLLPRGAYPFGPCLAAGGVAVFMQGTAVHSWFS